jgi:hypothetical protein
VLAARAGLILAVLFVASGVLATTAGAAAASLGTEPLDGAQVTDPAGDAGPGLTPVGAGFEAYDIVAIRFTEANETHLRIEIQVVDLPDAPPHGEIGAVFRINGSYYRLLAELSG